MTRPKRKTYPERMRFAVEDRENVASSDPVVIQAGDDDYARLFPKAVQQHADGREKAYTEAIERVATGLGAIRELFVELNTKPTGKPPEYLIEAARAAVRDARSQRDRYKMDLAQCQADRGKLKDDLFGAQQDVKNLTRSLEESAKLNEKLVEAVEQAAKTPRPPRVAELEAVIREHVKQIEGLSKTLGTRNETINGMKQTIDGLDDKLSIACAEKEAAEKSELVMQTQRNNLLDELQACGRKRDVVVGYFESYQKRIAKLTDERDAAKELADRYFNQITKLIEQQHNRMT